MLLAPATAGDAAISASGRNPCHCWGDDGTGGYARIVNSGHADVTLVRVDADFAAKAEIHTMFAEDGVMKMRPLRGRSAGPAHGKCC